MVLSGLPVNEALISGTIQIGLLGSAPMVQLMSRGIPIHPIAEAESRLEFAVAVPPGSPIKDLHDLVDRKAGGLQEEESRQCCQRSSHHSFLSVSPLEFSLVRRGLGRGRGNL